MAVRLGEVLPSPAARAVLRFLAAAHDNGAYRARTASGPQRRRRQSWWPTLPSGPRHSCALVSGSMGDGADCNLVESERDVLLFFLNRVRDAVVRASAGLTAEQQ